jgi:hypothetical protein
VTIAAARDLWCRRVREHYPCMTTGPAADGAGDAPLAWPGARWTEEEDEELVTAVRAVADLAVIAEQRGRTRGCHRVAAAQDDSRQGGYPRRGAVRLDHGEAG